MKWGVSKDEVEEKVKRGQSGGGNDDVRGDRERKRDREHN